MNQGEIQKFLFHVSNSDYANANKSLENIAFEKVKKLYDEAYIKVKESFSNKNNKTDK